MPSTQKKVNKSSLGRVPRDPVLESLRARKMSVFLLESSAADLNEEIKVQTGDGTQDVVKNLGEALKLAEKELGFLAALGKEMNLVALNEVTEKLRANIAKVELEDAADSDSKGFKQVAYITNGISKARVAVKTTVTTAFSVLKKLDVEMSGENMGIKVSALPVFGGNDAKITLEAFKAGLVKKLGDSAKGGGGFFKKLANFFGDSKSIEINGDKFVNNLVNLTLEDFQRIAESPVIKNAGVAPSAAEQKVQVVSNEVAKTGDADKKETESESKKDETPATSGDKKLSSIDGVKDDAASAEAALRGLLDDRYEKFIKANGNDPVNILKRLKAVKQYNDVLKKMGIKLETHVSRGDLLLERLNVLAGTSNYQTNRRDK